jgi:type I site-specific restriction endonuclease
MIFNYFKKELQMDTNDITEFFGTPIHSYTRAQAIADGVLIDVFETARELGFKFPVAVTDSVWRAYIEWTNEDTKKGYQQDSSVNATQG